MVGQKVLGLRHQRSLRHGTRLIIVKKQETHIQTAELVFFLYLQHNAQYILYVFEQFQLKPVFKNNSQGPSSCFFPSKSEPSYSDQGPVGTLSYILWGKLSTKKITVWLIFKSKRRSNTITYPRWKPQTVDFLLETHHILRRNSVCWLTSSFLCRVAQAAIVFY